MYLLVFVLIVAAILGLPTWRWHNLGPMPSIVISVVAVVLIVFLLFEGW